jgi:hypothetical protein
MRLRVHTRMTLLAGLIALLFSGVSKPVAAQDHGGRWFVSAQYGRTLYEREFVRPTIPCFKPCYLPDIERGSTATIAAGRRIGSLAISASVAPFLEKSTEMFQCGGSLIPPNCTSDSEFRRWLEYRLVAEVGGEGRVRPFVGGALGLAGYRRSVFEAGRDYRGIWEARAGVETLGALGLRLEVSRTAHSNPPWDAHADGNESFVDWQVKGGLRLAFGR